MCWHKPIISLNHWSKEERKADYSDDRNSMPYMNNFDAAKRGTRQTCQIIEQKDYEFRTCEL